MVNIKVGSVITSESRPIFAEINTKENLSRNQHWNKSKTFHQGRERTAHPTLPDNISKLLETCGLLPYMTDSNHAEVEYITIPQLVIQTFG
ncbi:hypothetical protein KIN20_003656 [Parelaphostrongylus tenuis]|uniref:Uncharacterized protein n=1 Tax=Parelaphostrongylus tenuis TaxID=148309 RepID=A0AAD5MG08_PARTN|nr:hypothetical protein KIN20_003656 [Parelaphostrongylus tenuis]